MPSFEIIKDRAARLRGIMRARQTLAGRQKSERGGGDFGGDRGEGSGHGLLGGEGAIFSYFFRHVRYSS